MHLLITGATGVAGSQALEQALLDPHITHVSVLVRKPINIQHPKLTVLLHHNFLDYASLEGVLNTCDVCVWCLGIAQSLVSAAEYEKITYDYTLAAAKALLKVNSSVKFIFVSGMGADPREKSRTLFARIKGKTENGLKTLPFQSLIIVRPGGIRPVKPRTYGAWYEKVMFPFFPVLETLFPAFFIASPDLGKALVVLAKEQKKGVQILENAALKLKIS